MWIRSVLIVNPIDWLKDHTARNFRALRKTIDTVVATRCFLLHNDRDFDPFVRHLGLRVVE